MQRIQMPSAKPKPEALLVLDSSLAESDGAAKHQVASNNVTLNDATMVPNYS